MKKNYFKLSFFLLTISFKTFSNCFFKSILSPLFFTTKSAFSIFLLSSIWFFEILQNFASSPEPLLTNLSILLSSGAVITTEKSNSGNKFLSNNNGVSQTANFPPTLSTFLKNTIISYPVPIDNKIAKQVIDHRCHEVKEAIADSLRRSRTLSLTKRDVINEEKKKYISRRDRQISQIIDILSEEDTAALLDTSNSDRD